MAKIDLGDIHGNSHTDRNNKSKVTQKPRLDPVVSSDKLVKSKKTLGEKFKNAFIKDDLKDIKTWIINDVVVPGVKGLILDTISMAFFHETCSRHGVYNGGSSNRVQYQSYFKSSNNSKPNNTKRIDNYNDNSDRVDYRDIILLDKQDAERIVSALWDNIRDYNQVSIGDLYSLIGVRANHADYNWGWTDERDINVRRVAQGFLIDVAPAVPID